MEVRALTKRREIMPRLLTAVLLILTSSLGFGKSASEDELIFFKGKKFEIGHTPPFVTFRGSTAKALYSMLAKNPKLHRVSYGNPKKHQIDGEQVLCGHFESDNSYHCSFSMKLSPADGCATIATTLFLTDKKALRKGLKLKRKEINRATTTGDEKFLVYSPQNGKEVAIVFGGYGAQALHAWLAVGEPMGNHQTAEEKNGRHVGCSKKTRCFFVVNNNGQLLENGVTGQEEESELEPQSQPQPSPVVAVGGRELFRCFPTDEGAEITGLRVFRSNRDKSIGFIIWDFVESFPGIKYPSSKAQSVALTRLSEPTIRLIVEWENDGFPPGKLAFEKEKNRQTTTHTIFEDSPWEVFKPTEVECFGRF
jgi:hypothetical protein